MAICAIKCKKNIRYVLPVLFDLFYMYISVNDLYYYYINTDDSQC